MYVIVLKKKKEENEINQSTNNSWANVFPLDRIKSTYLRVRCGIIGLINTHEKFWIKHILDHTTKFDKAIRLQVVQGNIVQRWNLKKPEKMTPKANR